MKLLMDYQNSWQIVGWINPLIVACRIENIVMQRFTTSMLINYLNVIFQHCSL